MRGVKALIGGTVLLGALVAAAEPSFAESFLQRLFGGFRAARITNLDNEPRHSPIAISCLKTRLLLSLCVAEHARRDTTWPCARSDFAL